MRFQKHRFFIFALPFLFGSLQIHAQSDAIPGIVSQANNGKIVVLRGSLRRHLIRDCKLLLANNMEVASGVHIEIEIDRSDNFPRPVLPGMSFEEPASTTLASAVERLMG